MTDSVRGVQSHNVQNLAGWTCCCSHVNKSGQTKVVNRPHPKNPKGALPFFAGPYCALQILSVISPSCIWGSTHTHTCARTLTVPFEPYTMGETLRCPHVRVHTHGTPSPNTHLMAHPNATAASYVTKCVGRFLVTDEVGPGKDCA